MSGRKPKNFRERSPGFDFVSMENEALIRVYQSIIFKDCRKYRLSRKVSLKKISKPVPKRNPTSKPVPKRNPISKTNTSISPNKPCHTKLQAHPSKHSKSSTQELVDSEFKAPSTSFEESQVSLSDLIGTQAIIPFMKVKETVPNKVDTETRD